MHREGLNNFKNRSLGKPIKEGSFPRLFLLNIIYICINEKLFYSFNFLKNITRLYNKFQHILFDVKDICFSFGFCSLGLFIFLWEGVFEFSLKVFFFCLFSCYFGDIYLLFVFIKIFELVPS